MEYPIPEPVQQIAAKLAERPGVIGVFWGQRRRGNDWVDEECISVHVRWKRHRDELSEDERIPPEIDGYPIDVIEVGAPRAEALDSTDIARVYGPRTSTISAIARRGSSVYALLSGHGVLPYSGTNIARSFEASEDRPMVVGIRDNAGGSYEGTLIRGTIDGERVCDWAVARFDTDEFEIFHYAAGGKTPLPMRNSRLSYREPVFHWSSSRALGLRGRFYQVAAMPVTLTLPDGTSERYWGVLAIGWTGDRFSIGGDSGSLVVDDQDPRHVVGMIVGSSASAPLTYVLPVHYLSKTLNEDLFKTFFR